MTAISHVDTHLFQLAKSRRFAEAATYLDLRFLIALGAGIGTGIVTLAGAMHWLLEHRMPETLAVFLGLVLGSVWIVRRYIDRWTISRWAACFAGIAVAVVICFLPVSHGDPTLPFLFLSASIAICAMILPGISGAFVMLLLGVYHPVTGLIKSFVKAQVTIDGLVQLVVFACGCLFGLLAFSRFLRWLLRRHTGTTMAALVGLMIGSIVRLWPLQLPTPATADLEFKYREMQYLLPGDWPGSMLTLVALSVVAATAVLVIERVAESKSSPVPESHPAN